MSGERAALLAECWEWPHRRSTSGYGVYRKKSAHRLAYALSVGPIPPELCVCHRCDNPPCCNPDHLFLGTAADNARDRVAKGRSYSWKGKRDGEANPRARLRASDVEVIREKLLEGRSSASIARDFAVSDTAIRDIKNGRTWLP